MLVNWIIAKRCFQAVDLLTSLLKTNYDPTTTYYPSLTHSNPLQWNLCSFWCISCWNFLSMINVCILFWLNCLDTPWIITLYHVTPSSNKMLIYTPQLLKVITLTPSVSRSSKLSHMMTKWLKLCFLCRIWHNFWRGTIYTHTWAFLWLSTHSSHSYNILIVEHACVYHHLAT